MTRHRAIVCASCPAGRAGLGAELAATFAEAGLAVTVEETDCMSACARASTLAFRAEGKMAYLFGQIEAEADMPGILAFVRLWLAAPDGVINDARPLGPLRMKAVARIPG